MSATGDRVVFAPCQQSRSQGVEVGNRLGAEGRFLLTMRANLHGITWVHAKGAHDAVATARGRAEVG